VKAITFDQNIERLTEGFTGREWVFEEIDRWLQQGSERFFILTGEPGVGKSAIAAQLTQTRKDIAAYHFCIARQISTVEPNNVLLSLAAQLIKYFPDYGEALVNTVKPLFLQVKVEINIENIRDSVVQGVVIENLHIHYPKQALDIVLRQALTALPNPPKEPISILIDSLDEAVTYSNENNLVTLLSSVDDLPSWVRFILTSRPDKQRVLSYFETLKPYYYHLNELSEKNKKDIHDYVDKRVVSEQIQAQIQKFQVQSEALINQITELSKGNFLYTKVLLDDIELGGQPIDNLAALPKSLNELYYNFLLRLKAEWEGKYQPIFGILTVTKAPVTEEELTNLLSEQLDETELGQRLRVVQQFLDVFQNDYAENTYTLFHQSLQDYLNDKEKSGVFHCSPKDGHRQIIEYCWQYHPRDWRECDRYGLRYLATHLVDMAALEKPPIKARKYIERLHELLFNFDWLQAKLDATDVNALIADFDFLSNAPDLSLVQSAIRLSSHILAQDKTQLWNQLYGRLIQYHDSSAIQTLFKVEPKQTWIRLLTPSLNQPKSPLIQTFRGHTALIKAIAITADNKKIISASYDKTIRIWDLRTGECLQILEGHRDEVSAVVIVPDRVPDRDKVISTSYDKTIRIWNIASGDCLHIFQKFDTWVTALAITTDNQQIVCVFADGTLQIWDIVNCVCINTWNTQLSEVNSIQIIPNTNLIIMAINDSVLVVMDLETGNHLYNLEGHNGFIKDFVVTTDSSKVISVSFDKTIRIWDLNNPQYSRILGRHEAVISKLFLFPGNDIVVSYGDDKKMKFWDLQFKHLLKSFKSNVDIFCFACIPARNKLVSGSWNGDINIWELEELEGNWCIPQSHKTGITAILTTKDNQLAISSSCDGTLKVWNIDSKECINSRQIHKDQINDIVLLPNQRQVISNSDDQNTIICDFSNSNMQCYPVFENCQHTEGLAITSDGMQVASGSVYSTIELWELQNRKSLKVLGRYNDNCGINSLVFTPNDKEIIAALDNHTLQIWNLDRSECTHILEGHTDTVTSIVITLDGKNLISGSHDKTLKIWDLYSKKLLKTLEGHNGWIKALAVSSDCKMIISASSDRSLRVWNLKNGENIVTWFADSELWSCTIAPDNKTIICGESSGRLHFLKIEKVEY
jgi:WD40 repeat protein/archaellum biogenesis ATPase FlaH